MLVFVFLVHTSVGQTVSGLLVGEQQKPIVGATIHLHELERYTTSNDSGKFIFNHVPKGRYHLDITHVGYEPVSIPFSIPQKQPLTISLHKTQVEMKEVVVEESMTNSLHENRARDIVVFDEKKLTQSTAAGLVETLSDLPGVDLIKIGNGTAKPIIRGLGFNRVMTNLNGIKQEGQQWGADHGLAVDQNSIQRAEVVKGANSLIYGSDAIGGVLNLQQFATIPQPGIHGKVGLRSQSVSMRYNPYGRLTLRKGDNYAAFSGSYAAAGDIKVPADEFNYNSYVYPIYGNQLKNTATTENAFSAMAGLLKEWGKVQISANRFDQTLGFFPGAHGRPDFDLLFDDGDRFDIDLPYQTIEHLNVVATSAVFFEKGRLEVDAGYQENNRRELEVPHSDKRGPEPTDNLALGLAMRTISLNARYHREVALGKTITGISLQHQRNRESGFEYFLPNYHSEQLGVFYYREHPLTEKTTLNFGGRADVSNQSIAEKELPVYDANDAYTGDTVITKAGVYQFANATGAIGLVFMPSHYQTWKLNLGSGFRFPTVPELTANGFHHGTFRYELGNRNLVPERTLTLDGSVSWHKEHVDVSFSPYFNYFLGYIFLSPSGKFASKYYGGGQIHTYEQADAIHTGAEVSVDYHPIKSFHLGINGSYVVGHNIETNRPLPFMPPFTGLATIGYELELAERVELSPYVSVRAFAPQNRVAINELATPGALVLNTGANFGWTQALTVSFAVENLLNTSYFYHLSRFRILNLPEQGRNISLSLTFTF